MKYTLTDADVVRLWSKIKKAGPDEHWEWLGGRYPSGRPAFWLNADKNNVLAYRVLWQVIHGEIPKGFHIDHECNFIGCMNPAHHCAKTPRKNILRSNNACAQNKRKDTCKRGHPFGPQPPYFEKRGWRRCLTCAMDQQRERRKPFHMPPS